MSGGDWFWLFVIGAGCVYALIHAVDTRRYNVRLDRMERTAPSSRVRPVAAPPFDWWTDAPWLRPGEEDRDSMHGTDAEVIELEFDRIVAADAEHQEAKRQQIIRNHPAGKGGAA